MKASVDWLRQYADVALSPDELVARLLELGIEVEAVGSADGDTTIEVEVGANRPDLLSMFGLAREIAAATGGTLRMPDVRLECGGGSIDGLTAVSNDAPDLCLRYTARVITGVRVEPSPLWLQTRLESVGLRPVNNVVDVTNFVLMECGQPLHAFDFDKLRGRRIVVRRAKPGETITVIDGTVRTLTDEMCVIADAEVPAAVAGIMGGIETEIGAGTTTVLLESARFLPASIRRTSRALGLISDSSYRFERGVDPKMVDWGSRRAAELIAKLTGGHVAAGVIDVGEPEPKEQTVSLRPARTVQVIGADIPPAEQRRLLDALGFRCLSRGDERTWLFSVPTFRPDITREIDLIEEIARTYGYGKVPEKTRMRVRAVPVQDVDAAAARIRQLLVGMGYCEARTSSFLPINLAERFTTWSFEVNVIRNPVSREEPALRTSIIPLLLRAKKINLHKGTPSVALFELSHIYRSASGEPSEKTCLALLDDGGFAFLRGALDALFEQFGVAGDVAYAGYGDANLDAGRSAALSLRGEPLGVLGEIRPELAELFGIPGTPAVAELDFDLLLRNAKLDRRYRPLPRFPSVRRDLCVIVDEQVPWAGLSARARSEAGGLAESVAFLSEYRGEQIPAGKKAVAFTLTCRAENRTLTGEEADETAARVARALEEAFGAELRA